MASKIAEVGFKFENLVPTLQDYEHELAQVEDILTLSGKTLEQANKENPSWFFYYDQKRVELHTLTKYAEALVLQTRSKLFQKLSVTSNLDLSDRAKDKYIDGETEYLSIYQVFLEVKEMYDKYQAVCDAFQTRGYTLNNVTKARISEMENSQL